MPKVPNPTPGQWLVRIGMKAAIGYFVYRATDNLWWGWAAFTITLQVTNWVVGLIEGIEGVDGDTR